MPRSPARPSPTSGGSESAAEVVDSRYFVLTLPGLERIASRELVERTGEEPTEGTAGIVLLEDAAADGLLECRTAEDAFASLAILRLRDSDQSLAALFQAVRDSPNWGPAVAAWRERHERRGRRITVRVVAQLLGAHRFRRVDLSRTVSDAVEQRAGGAWRWDPEKAGLEIWARMDRRWAAVGIRLTEPQSRRPSLTPSYYPGSARQSVAAAIARLSRPSPDDRVLDPSCGNGSVIIERAVTARYADLTAGAVSLEALDACRANAGPRYRPLRIEPMDLAFLTVESGAVTRILSALADDTLYQEESAADQRVAAALDEFARVLEPGGRLVIMPPDPAQWIARTERSTVWQPGARYRVQMPQRQQTLLVFDRRH